MSRTVQQFLSSSDAGCHRQREIAAIVSPNNVKEVREVVADASADRSGIYPVSTGRNWGMGSKIPISPGCTVVNLGGMRRIRELDLTAGYAVIEPGVTQRQLADALEHTPWITNVTSSCADTSIIGNTLERGDGALGPRTNDVLGLEIVLANGEMVTTGGLDRLGRYHGRVAGPDLTSACYQSNFGVITAMAISLTPRAEATAVFVKRVHRRAVAQAVARLGCLSRGHMPTTGLFRIRELVVPAVNGEAPVQLDRTHFTMTGSLLGSAGAVELAGRMIREATADLPGDADLRIAMADEIEPGDVLYERCLMARGIPTCGSLRALLGVDTCEEVDSGAMGMLATLPLFPTDVRSVDRVLDILAATAERFQVVSTVEWNLVPGPRANGVIQTIFDRTDEDAAERAHAFRRSVKNRLFELGWLAYRSDIDHAPHELLKRDDGVSLLVAQIKEVVDPYGVISPGRYVPSSVSVATSWEGRRR